ncbi:AAA family ATPase [Aquibacillus halophilus]|uniref:AAA family ATPase n=1 Tax=Aquibacillus halophilus TaxID=930132 RepID=A0A6A8DKN3_9BACI|nr:AAA family ATPase [Aquibacillus halophilus]MRH44319.1 AAA family ATPase [Aquibacillus halophilus]
MSETENTNHLGKVIAVCSAKGGIGRTLISVNLAVALNKKNLNICIVDGDLQFGDISLAMDLQPSFTIKDVVDEIDQLDAGGVGSYLTDHSSGVKVLSAPDRPEYAELVTGNVLAKTVRILQQQFDYVIVDNGIGIQDQTVDLIEHSDQILMVTNLEMTALKNTKLMLETLGQLGIRDKVRLVINRYNMESLIEADEVPKMLGENKGIYIPNNFKLASQSLNLGIPFVISQSKSDLSKAIFKMAEGLTSKDSTFQATKKKSILPNIFSSKAKG